MFDSCYRICSNFSQKLSLNRKLRPMLITESSEMDGAEYPNNIHDVELYHVFSQLFFWFKL